METAERMVELAGEQPGFPGGGGECALGGGIYLASEEAIQKREGTLGGVIQRDCWTMISSSYKWPVVTAVVTQVLALSMSATLMDGGMIFRVCGLATLAFWAIAGTLIARHPRSPTSVDLGLIRAGYLLVVAVGIYLAR